MIAFLAIEIGHTPNFPKLAVLELDTHNAESINGA
jgi:hypothetical protein